MISDADWARAYAQQAKADFAAYYELRLNRNVPPCASLHFLQMACEKLVKASLLRSSSRLTDIDTTHSVIRKTLARIYVQYYNSRHRVQLSDKSHQVRQIKLFAQEIDALHPSVNREQRPDNCEYPWIDSGGNLITPALFKFSVDEMLAAEGAQFVRFLSVVIDELAA